MHFPAMGVAVPRLHFLTATSRLPDCPPETQLLTGPILVAGSGPVPPNAAPSGVVPASRAALAASGAPCPHNLTFQLFCFIKRSSFML